MHSVVRFIGLVSRPQAPQLFPMLLHHVDSRQTRQSSWSQDFLRRSRLGCCARHLFSCRREEEEKRKAASEAAASSSVPQAAAAATPSARAAQRRKGVDVSHYPAALQRASSLDSVSTHISGKSTRSRPGGKAKRGRGGGEEPDAAGGSGRREGALATDDDASDDASSVSGSMPLREVAIGRGSVVAAGAPALPARSRLRPAKHPMAARASVRPGLAQGKSGRVPAAGRTEGKVVVERGQEEGQNMLQGGRVRRVSMEPRASNGSLRGGAGGGRKYVSPYSQRALRQVPS